MATNVSYRVYRAADGDDPIYCGEYSRKGDAIAAAKKEPGGLPKCLWATSVAANAPIGGLYAPGEGTEDPNPIGWYGKEGWHCVVRVVHDAS